MDNRAALTAFGESLAARGSPQTQARYLRACESLITTVGDTPLAHIKRHDLQRALAKLHAQGLSPRTLAVTLSAWRAWYRYLSKSDAAVSSTVFVGIKAPKAAKRLPNALTETEAVQLVTAPDEHTSKQSAWIATRDQAMFEVLYGCGIRVGELIGIDLADVDLANHELRVFGKGRKERVVPLGGPACAAMKSWLTLRATAKRVIDTNAAFLGARFERVAAGHFIKRLSASLAPFVCLPCAAKLRRFAGGARAHGPCEHRVYAGLHSSRFSAFGEGLRPSPSARASAEKAGLKACR